MVETTTARFSYEGQKFEILVKPDQALEFKLGKRTDITSVLISEDIYTDYLPHMVQPRLDSHIFYLIIGAFLRIY